MNPFVRHYLIAALYLETDGDFPLDRNYTVESFSVEAVERAVKDCDRFRSDAVELLAAFGEQDDEDIAYNFWARRNNHGVGFWDGDYPEHGEQLTENSQRFGEVDVVVGDDNKLYFA